MTSDLLLLITAFIWGFAFVAQRMGMDHMGPLTFNAIRFSLGSLALLPVLRWQKQHHPLPSQFDWKNDWLPVLITGLVLFTGAALQQVGLVGTTAGKAGFITGLYVILVPLMALLWGSRTHSAHWAGALLAVIGLYLLSVREDFTISPYDLVVLVGAFVWAGHVHLIGRFSDPIGPIRLAASQFAICGLFSGVGAILFEDITMAGILGGLGPILYGSFLSVGLAFTLQVVAQRKANPSHAGVIMSLEGAFAALGGWLVLGEVLAARDLLGCALMLGGMLISQFLGRQRKAPLPIRSG